MQPTIEELQAQLDATRAPEPTPTPEAAPSLAGLAVRAITPAGGPAIAQEIARRSAAPAAPPVSPEEELARKMDGTKFDGGPVSQFFAGAMERIADTLGYPADRVAEAFQNGGTGVLDLMNETSNVLNPFGTGNAPRAKEGSIVPSKAGTEALKKAFAAVGLPADAPDTMAAEIGETTMTGLMILGGLVLTRGKLGALGTPAAGAKVAERIMRTIPRWASKAGEAAVQSPGKAIAAEFGGAVGAEAGEDIGGLPGAIAGGVAGALSAPTAFKVAGKVASMAAGISGIKAAGRGLAKAGQALTGQALPPEQALLSGVTSPEAATDAATQFVNRENAIIDKKLADTINAVQPKQQRGWYATVKESERVNQDFYKGLEDSEKLGNHIEKKLWGEATTGKSAMTTDLKTAMDELEEFNRINQSSGALPADIIAEIRDLDEVVTANKLVNIRSAINDMVRSGKARTGEVLGGTRIANLNKIKSSILDTLNTQLASRGAKTSAKLTAARAFSTRMAEIFDQGPVGEALASARSGGPKMAPEVMAQHIMSKMGGTKQIMDIGPAIAKGQKRVKDMTAVPDMEQLFADGVRDMWVRATKGLDPAAAARAQESFMKVNGPKFQKMARVYAELKNQGDELTALAAQRKEIEGGAAAKFMGQDVEAGVNSILSNPNPAEYTAGLMKAITDPDAVKSIQERTIAELIKRNGRSPSKLVTVLGDTKTARMLNVMFRNNPNDLARLKKIAETAARIEQGDEKGLAKGSRRAGIFISKFFGAGVGRYLASLTGGGAIQKAHYMAEAFRSAAESLLNAMPVEDLVASAALSPHWERVLFARVPTNDTEARALMRALKLAIGAQQGYLTHIQRKEEKGLE